MKKINLNSVKEFLSRAEMKAISGGSGGGGWCEHYCSPVGSGCTINGRQGTCYSGTCDSSPTRMCYA